MDLSAYGRVLRTYWPVVLGGLAIATSLAILSFYRVSTDGLTPRKAELWQSSASVFLTEKGFPVGQRQISPVKDPQRFSSLASLYARLAVSDQVRARMIAKGGPLEGTYDALGAADTNFGRDLSLPVVTIFGKGATAAAARRMTARALQAFTSYVVFRQKEAKIARNNRVILQVVNEPQAPVLIEGRKRTLPVAVFLAVLFASLALAFVLDNARRTRRSVRPAEPPATAGEVEEPEAATASQAALRWRRTPGSTAR